MDYIGVIHRDRPTSNCSKKFPLPSILLLNKMQQGGANSVKALKIIRENGKASKDCILMDMRCI